MNEEDRGSNVQEMHCRFSTFAYKILNKTAFQLGGGGRVGGSEVRLSKGGPK